MAMTLEDTVAMMRSSDYKERFKAEYYQCKIRIASLDNMLNALDSDQLSFTPTCSKEILQVQLQSMRTYLSILNYRAEIEGIEVDTSFQGE